MPDADLAAAAGAPLELARALRGARTLVEAREIARQILDPQPCRLGEEARLDAGAVRRASRRLAPTLLDEAGARAIVRELKAVGGNLKLLRLALTGRRAGARAVDRRRRCAARRGASPGRRRYNTAMTVRLYDTATRSLARCPTRPRRSACTSAARPSTSAPTSATRCPFVIFAWLRNWLREHGYDVTYVHNITDINDKIYEAAPGASAERAREATQWYLDDTRLVRARDARRAAARDRDDSRDRRADRGADRGRPRVRGRRRRLLPRRELRELRRALGPAARSGRGAGAEPAEGGSRATSRSGRRRRRARTRPGRRPGAPAGRAGTSSARRWRRRRSGPSS